MTRHPSPITPEGHRRLSRDIVRLKTSERPQLVAAIRDTSRADGMGDISAAKRQLVDLDTRIAALEVRLAASVIVDPAMPPEIDRVHFGAHVLCEDEAGESCEMILVGPEESDPRQGRISWNAPAGRAQAGAEVGSLVSFQTPRGPRDLEVLAISYPETAATLT